MQKSAILATIPESVLYFSERIALYSGKEGICARKVLMLWDLPRARIVDETKPRMQVTRYAFIKFSFPL